MVTIRSDSEKDLCHKEYRWFKVLLTQQELDKLQAYANSQGWNMSQTFQEWIKGIPLEKIMSEIVNSEELKYPEQVEQDKLQEPSIENNNNKKDNALIETAELLSAVGDLTHDAYINTVRQARFFVKFLHKQIKPSQEEGDRSKS
ncbi:hypothetical protein [Brasilonema sp. UFV-L1]|uniref:hypothetical protein n=1 Tax=Brasilonema sp. UFV-L1 TaxID=2234130 RepID=UPI00145CE4C4|nr:hypothetical protein [Brasilonema sp. UFV-L1]NMG07990.1 hypothetical protein [Brasilonema sp. UFV-L1]